MNNCKYQPILKDPRKLAKTVRFGDAISKFSVPSKPNFAQGLLIEMFLKWAK